MVEGVETVIEITDYMTGEKILKIDDFVEESCYLDLFLRIREELTDKANMRISLGRSDRPDDPPFKETSEYYDLPIFEEGHPITEYEGKQVKYISYDAFIFPRKKLRVYFFAENNDINKNYEIYINQYLERFMAKDKNECHYQKEKVVCTFSESVGTISKEEDDVIVVITAGRYIKDVIQNAESIFSILIFTSHANYNTLKEEYKKEDVYPQVKDVSVRAESLLRDEYFYCDE